MPVRREGEQRAAEGGQKRGEKTSSIRRKARFGTCRLQVTPTDDGVEMEFRTLVRSGDFPRGELEEYRRIAEARKEAYNGHFVVKRP